MKKLIIVINPPESVGEYICGEYPCFGDGDDIVIPYDCWSGFLGLSIEFNLEYKIIEY